MEGLLVSLLLEFCIESICYKFLDFLLFHNEMGLEVFLYLTKQLETDMQILLENADMALKNYKMHMVVAKELLTRKGEVVVVTSNGKISIFHYKTLVGDVVENPLIRLIVERHSAYVEMPDL